MEKLSILDVNNYSNNNTIEVTSGAQGLGKKIPFSKILLTTATLSVFGNGLAWFLYQAETDV